VPLDGKVLIQYYLLVHLVERISKCNLTAIYLVGSLMGKMILVLWCLLAAIQIHAGCLTLKNNITI